MLGLFGFVLNACIKPALSEVQGLAQVTQGASESIPQCNSPFIVATVTGAPAGHRRRAIVSSVTCTKDCTCTFRLGVSCSTHGPAQVVTCAFSCMHQPVSSWKDAASHLVPQTKSYRQPTNSLSPKAARPCGLIMVCSCAHSQWRSRDRSAPALRHPPGARPACHAAPTSHLDSCLPPAATLATSAAIRTQIPALTSLFTWYALACPEYRFPRCRLPYSVDAVKVDWHSLWEGCPAHLPPTSSHKPCGCLTGMQHIGVQFGLAIYMRRWGFWCVPLPSPCPKPTLAPVTC